MISFYLIIKIEKKRGNYHAKHYRTTELVGLMAYPIRHTQSPTTHNLAYDKNGGDVIQLAFVDNDTLGAAVESIVR